MWDFLVATSEKILINFHIFIWPDTSTKFIISTYNQYKIVNEILSFSALHFKIQYELNVYSISQLELSTFQVLSNYMWLMAAEGRAELEGPTRLRF